MDLYPVVRRITVQDSYGREMKVTGDKPELHIAVGNIGVFAYLNIAYAQPSLTVAAHEFAYTADGTSSDTPLPGVSVTLYPHNSADEAALGVEATDHDGNAVFRFSGTLTITKAVSDGSNDGVFVFKISNKKDPNTVTQSLMLSPGESVTVVLPYGEYTVVEDTSWAWRYTAATLGDATVSNMESPTVAFVNTPETNQWFDWMTRNKNEFK